MGIVLFWATCVGMFVIVPALISLMAADLLRVRDWRMRGALFIACVIAVWHLWQVPK